MKKNLFFLAVAAVALASCSSDETTAVNQSLRQADAIGFRTLIDGTTRAASTSDVTTAGITTFNVTAFPTGTTSTPYIDDVTYTKSTAGETFFVNTVANASSLTSAEMNNQYYWPAGNLDFYAYSVNSAVASQVSRTAYNSFTVTPATADNSTYADLVVSTIQNIGKTSTYDTGTKKYGADGVPLNFRHTGSKIAVKVKNTSANLKFSVEGWKVGYLDGEGTFTLGETETATSATLNFSDWTDNTTQIVGTAYVSSFSPTTINASSSAAALDGEMILVPQRITAATEYANNSSPAAGDKLNGSFIAVKLKIMNTDALSTVIADDGAGNAIWAIWPIGDDGGATPFNWEPGKKYTYTIDLAGGGYYETNKDDDEDLDPILEGAIIKFVSVTVDTWTEVSPDIDVTNLP